MRGSWYIVSHKMEVWTSKYWDMTGDQMAGKSGMIMGQTALWNSPLLWCWWIAWMWSSHSCNFLNDLCPHFRARNPPWSSYPSGIEHLHALLPSTSCIHEDHHGLQIDIGQLLLIHLVGVPPGLKVGYGQRLWIQVGNDIEQCILYILYIYI